MPEVWIVKAGEALPLGGGRRGRAGQLSAALADRGHAVTWWNSTFSHVRKQHEHDRQTEVQFGPNERAICLHGPAYRKNVSLARLLNHRAEAAAFLREAEKQPRPDLIIAAMPTLDLADAASIFAMKHSVPFIVDVRDQWPDVFVWALPKPLRRFGPILFHPLYRQLRRVLSRADAITSVGEGMLDWAMGHAGRPRRSGDLAFYTGCKWTDLPPFERAAADDWAREQGLTGGDRILAVCASLNPASCGPLADVARAFSAAPPPGWRLVIAGDGPLAETLRDAAGPNVLLTGRLDRPKVEALLRSASAGLIPYPNRPDFMGACPNKLGEYLSAGLPVISGLHGETGTLLRTSGAGWTCQGPDDLPRLLERLTPAELAVAAQAARRLFHARFASATARADHASRYFRTRTFRVPEARSSGLAPFTLVK